MQSCKNAIEELVIAEIDLQISHLPQYRRDQINLSEVAAYALNRLPPMYATSKAGWLRQRKKAATEMRSQIESAVRRALVSVKPDALRDSRPLPSQEVASHARSLAALQQLLGAENASWKDIPTALENALMTVKIKSAVSNTYIITGRKESRDETAISSKSPEISWKGRQVKTFVNSSQDEQKARDFQTYMVDVNYQFSNVLEKLVLSLAYHQIQKLHPAIAETVDLGEATAYVLNRLPPMYATSEKGYKSLRLRAREVYGKEVVAVLKEAIAVCVEAPNLEKIPIPLARFEAELEESLEQVSWILQRDDINWRNAPFIVEECLHRVVNNEMEWRKRSDYNYPYSS
ncbi:MULTISPECIES: late competence development ComFB family protein [Pseudanabaena]|uniref:Late competence development protein ComFB n=2 Tax=Pseudanabaena TaxID=1152 RepID=L8MYB8_9CYAN|nr:MULTISPECIES: late competence development ComFB family protein [Pseudanabaena]ELS32481.1 Late competence development protein ComFB [Pseudanabaena biceps PCC 7429]MDG3495261.1 late competence development ComFB family protein [Pseudanabaena catenata USMAC16]